MARTRPFGAGPRGARCRARSRGCNENSRKLFPDLDTRADYSWVASFGETETGLPTISEIPRHKNCWVALGYGGNGITYSRIAADVIRAALIGQRDPDADLYAFRS